MSSPYFDHLFEYFSLLKKETAFKGPEYFSWELGLPHPYFNGCFLTEPAPWEWEQTIDRNRSYFEDRELPYTWFSHKQNDISLESWNFTPLNTQACLSLSLNPYESFDKKKSPNIRIELVKSTSDLKTWIDITLQVFLEREKTQTFSSFLYENIAPLLSNSRPILYNFIAYQEELAIATISLFLPSDESNPMQIGSLWNCAVLEQARQKGVGSALCLKALTKARQLGASQILALTADGGWSSKMLTSLGFSQVFEIYPYASPALQPLH